MLYHLKRLIPKPLLQLYHFALAKLSVFLYRHPSDGLIVIGVTGTNGKSSTVQFIAQMLESLGHSVGYTTTAGFSIAGKKIENKMKMTMPGRFYLQRILKDMVRAGCEYAVIETSSEGIAQYRHLGINYDVAVFTNLTPEHLESHGGFENYKRAKGRLFHHLTRMPHKTIQGKKIQKVSVVNVDDPHADYFTAFEADDMVSFSWEKSIADVRGKELAIPLAAPFQKMNATAAVAALIGAGISRKTAFGAVSVLKDVPGRFERIEGKQPFTVVVDYAYEPYALQALFDAVAQLKPKRIIGIHGSAGGGRDIARREQIGELAAKHEAVVIVTNEDPYDEDPRAIMEAVAKGAEAAGLVRDKNVFIIEDRQEAIDRAIEIAQEGDVVLLTGKGSEPVIAVAGGKKIPWSDREAAEKALKRHGYL